MVVFYLLLISVATIVVASAQYSLSLANERGNSLKCKVRIKLLNRSRLRKVGLNSLGYNRVVALMISLVSTGKF